MTTAVSSRKHCAPHVDRIQKKLELSRDKFDILGNDNTSLDARMKKRRDITLADISRWRSFGLGTGTSAEYRPWLTIRDVPSRGRKSRPWGITTGRVHHLLSDNELHFFLCADQAAQVLDIREQYPLFPQESTLQIAANLGIRHPYYPRSTTPVVLTTDFVLTIRRPDGTNGLRAYSIKSSQEFRERGALRVLEKLELERRYWCALNVPWSIVTEREFDNVRIANLEWLSHSVYAKCDIPLERLSEFLQFVVTSWTDQRPLSDMLDLATAMLGLQSRDVADRLFRYCVWRRLVEVDLRKKVSLRAPVDIRCVNRAFAAEV
ncbi:TnsA endonuclease N-terminal domain-containing protein [Paraburkholderia tropica]|uniref:TnsA endonuclease N-terminal domain-containing protein n=1 Tax=Paraburkholderia tropica TaxID=92647 RepID=UPI001CC4CAE6|nr:TnsA endonuclease N-terminal domain-containing protein [Paraburkholderia tropica]